MNRGNSLLFAVAAALTAASAARLWAFSASSPATQPIRPPPVAAVTEASVATAEAQPWSRPLFSLSASGSDLPSEVTGSTGSAQLPKLIGIVADGDRRVAVMVFDGKAVRVDAQQRIGTWTVVRVDPHSALLEDAQSSFRIRLDPAASRD